MDLVSENGITFTELVAWNTWLSEDCDTALFANIIIHDDRAVCIGVGSTSMTAPATSTVSGIASNCDECYTVVSGDSCAQIESTYGITFARLYEWNPAIGSNCQSLGVGYSVCVGVSS
jgi:hypothetical protein